MPAKHQNTSVLDEQALPQAVEAALAANERVKYYFTLLQLAVAHAEQPEVDLPSLQAERRAAAIDDEWLDGLVGSARAGRERLLVPRAREVVQRIVDDVGAMVQPFRVRAQAPAAPAAAVAERQAFEQRLARLGPAALAVLGEAGAGLTSRYLSSLTAPRGDDDNLHRLVMELHRALDRLASELPGEDLAGARAYEIAD